MNISLAQKHADLDQHNAKLLAQFARDTDDNHTLAVRGATPAGDEARLRGIPAIGRGVQGAINGTRP